MKSRNSLTSIVACLYISFAQTFQPTSTTICQRSQTIILMEHRDSVIELFAEQTKTVKRNSERRRSHSRSFNRRSGRFTPDVKNPDEVDTWRIFGVDVSPDELGPNRKGKSELDVSPEKSYMTKPVLESLLSRLRIKREVVGTNEIELPPELISARVIRRSIDARRRKGSDPKYTYVIDVDITRGNARAFKFVHQPGRMERVNNSSVKRHMANELDNQKSMPKVVIVGAGPGNCSWLENY